MLMPQARVQRLHGLSTEYDISRYFCTEKLQRTPFIQLTHYNLQMTNKCKCRISFQQPFQQAVENSEFSRALGFMQLENFENGN